MLKNKLLILICVYLAGFGTARYLQKPLPPATSSHETEVAKDLEQGRKDTKTTKVTFNCDSGKPSSIETTQTVEDFLNERTKAKEAVKVSVPQAAPLPDNFLATGDSTLRFTALVNPYSVLPILPKELWVGYAKDVRTGEDIGVVGYSKRLF